MSDESRPVWARAMRPERSTERKPITHVLPPGAGSKHARTALANEVAILAATPTGERNNQLNESAFNLFQLVAGGHLPYDDAFNALHTTALAIGLDEHEVIATLASAHRGGSKSPREVAQLDPLEGPEATVYTLPTAIGPDDEDGEPLPPPTIGERFPVIDWHELWADETQEEWIAEPLLPARRLVALFSPPKVGKSLLMLEIAVAVAMGTEVFGRELTQSHRVLYVDFENDPRGDVRTRLQSMGRKPEELDDLFYLSYPRLAFLDTYIGGLELMAVVEHYDVKVVVIDTISRAVTGEENDNDTWLGFYRHTGLLLKAAGIATIRLDHTGKDTSKGMRGGSAKYGDVDAVWAMTKLAEDKFSLECTANRLPITEKTLVLERELAPLRHRVTTQRIGAVLDEEVERLVGLLDDMAFPSDGKRGSGSPAATKALKAFGIKAEDRHVRKAVAFRVERERSKDQPFDSSAFMDDEDDGD